MEADKTLLDAARRGNADALREIFDLYAPALYKYAFRLCGDALRADHIVGNVFAKLLEQLSAGTGPRVNLRLYLYEVAYHLVSDEARDFSSSVPFEVDDSIHHDVNSTRLGVENPMWVEPVLGAIQKNLTDDQRHVVILRFLEGFSLKETAVIIGKKVGAVKVIQSRAMAALRKALE